MNLADSYQEWYELAAEHDRVSGNESWRNDESSGLYDHNNINTRLAKLRRLRKKGDDHGLLFALNEGIHGNMGGMGKTSLHHKANCGTKLLIEDYINEICESLLYLSTVKSKRVSRAETIEFYRRASHCYGRSALMLSGGGTLGFFHFGVLKALIEQGLCPVVISGSSAGAIVASVVGTHSDEEYLALFEDNRLVDELTSTNKDAKTGGLLNNVKIGQVKKVMERIIPNMTFQEAYEKTGRSINISVSPAEPRQTSRLLNHIASPNVTIRSAVLASSAIPGIFPSVQLKARDVDGKIKPYIPSRRWIDGSFSQDLPAKRLARMYGVNHFIVSQVLPGVGHDARKSRPGITKTFTDASMAATKQIVRGLLDVVQHRVAIGPKIATGMEALNAVIDQQYSGDINILPRYSVLQIANVLRVSNKEETQELFSSGERATWPKIPAIRTTTRIGRTLDKILHEFEVEEAHWLSSAPKTESLSKNLNDGADDDLGDAKVVKLGSG